MEIFLYFSTMFLMFVSAFVVAVIFGCKALDNLFQPSEPEKEKEETSLPS